MSEEKKTIGVKQGVQPAASTQKFRRIITGHNEAGKAVIIEDEICPNRFACGGVETFVTNEMWRMSETPADNSGDYEDEAANFALNPPAGGNVFRLLEIPPDTDLGTDENGNPYPPDLHRTASIDYAFVVSGEVYAVLDDGVETLMKAGTL